MIGTEKNLIELGRYLKETGYRFVTPTPESHRRIIQRVKMEPDRPATLRDVFGWNRSFQKNELPQNVIRFLEEAGAIEQKEGRLRSKIRFSTLGEDLFLHSSYPTVETDSVFFGPDTYRFASLIRRELGNDPDFRAARIIDIGCGSGAGAIVALRCLSGQNPELIFTDINPQALSYARVNCAIAGLEKTDFILSDVLDSVSGSADLIISNPPYLVDPEARLYRNGGGDFGCALSIRIAEESVKRLTRGGKLILYTGTPVVAGEPVLLKKLGDVPAFSNGSFGYEEIDPDVFGEELERLHNHNVERIAAVSITAASRAGG
jgi:methylase of polypeptide subunit release factors